MNAAKNDDFWIKKTFVTEYLHVHANVITLNITHLTGYKSILFSETSPLVFIKLLGNVWYILLLFYYTQILASSKLDILNGCIR